MTKSVKGKFTCQYIPAKRGSFRVHHPMVTLEFEVDGGGSLQLFASECSNAKAVYKSLCEQLATAKGWTKPLMVPTLEYE